MKIKSKLITLTCLIGMSLQLNAAGTISGPGYYYAAYPIGVTPTYVTIFLKGSFTDLTECGTARSNEYNPSNGILPWDGGAGCHYIAANDVANANDLYSVAFNPGSGPIIGLDAEMLEDYFQQVNEINQAYNIKNYRQEINRLIASYIRPQR